MRPNTAFRSRQLGSLGNNPGAVLAAIRDLGINPDAYFRANTPLPKNAQEVIDGAIASVGRQRLVVVADLIDLGLTTPLPGWMGIPVLTTSITGETGRAKRTETMENVRGENQLPDIANISIPTYITWDDYKLSSRFLAVAERVGYPIDTTSAEQATRNVNESFEDTVINGFVDEDSTLIKVYNTNTYGLINAPNRNTFTFENNRAWDNAAKTGAGIYADIKSAIALLKANNFNGPYRAYVPKLYEDPLALDYTSGYPKTVRERIREGYPDLTIKVADFLPANTIVVFQATRDVIDLVVGQLPTSATWPTNPGQPMTSISSVVWGVVIPRVKYDYNAKSGIVIGTPT